MLFIAELYDKERVKLFPNELSAFWIVSILVLCVKSIILLTS